MSRPVPAGPLDAPAPVSGDGPRTRAEVVAILARRLGSSSEARWLVEHVTRCRPGAAAHGAALHEGQRAELAQLADRRASGEPLQYVLGTWPFRAVELSVDPRALVPRPETEQMVEVALAALHRSRAGPAPSDGFPGPVVVDLGTGTGAIALTMAVELAATRPGLAVWAVDDDPDALALAARNRARVADAWPDADVTGRVRLAAGSWYEALPPALRGRVDLVVANPPYVAEEEWCGLDPEVRKEPRHALVAEAGRDGTPGMAAVEAVVSGAPEWLVPGGTVVVETAPHQAGAAAALARRLGFRRVEVAQDLAGRDRAVVARD